MESADDARGDRPLEPERVPDRDDGVADPDGVRVCEGERRERLGRHVDLQHRQVRGRIRADDRRPDRVLVREADLDARGALDDVIVRDDVAVLVDHEARPERLLCLARDGIAEDVDAGLPVRGRGDLDDARPAATVDSGDVDGGRAGRRRDSRLLRGDRSRLDERRGIVERADRPRAGERHAATEKGSGGERGDRSRGGREPARACGAGRIGASRSADGARGLGKAHHRRYRRRAVNPGLRVVKPRLRPSRRSSRPARGRRRALRRAYGRARRRQRAPR